VSKCSRQAGCHGQIARQGCESTTRLKSCAITPGFRMTKFCILLLPSKFLVRYSAVPSMSEDIVRLGAVRIYLPCDSRGIAGWKPAPLKALHAGSSSRGGTSRQRGRHRRDLHSVYRPVYRLGFHRYQTGRSQTDLGRPPVRRRVPRPELLLVYQGRL